MSDSAPLLLNLGADTAQVANPSGMAGIQASETSTEGGDFARVLQGALQSKADSMPVNNTNLNTQAKIDPILLESLDTQNLDFTKNLNDSLFTGQEGSILPEQGQEVAWQTLLAEYDSENPGTPRGIIASGDEHSYQLKELAPKDFIADIQQDTEQVPVAKLHDDKADLNPVSLKSEDINSVNSPGHTINNQSPTIGNPDINTAVDKSGKLSGVDTNQQSESSQQDQLPLDKDVTSKKDSTSDKDMSAQDKKLEAGFSRLDGNQAQQEQAKQQAIKNEAQSITDSVNNKTANVSSSQAAQNASSSYSTISALGNTNAASQTSHLQLIANMTVPPQNPAWGDIVGDRVHWMVNQNIQEAKIRLNPPDLGFLEVRVQVGSDQQTNISFTSPHSQVRDALETAMPRLRELFNDNGLTLGDVNVSHQSMTEKGNGEQGDNSGHSGKSHFSETATDEKEQVTMLNRAPSSSGMLDLYA